MRRFIFLMLFLVPSYVLAFSCTEQHSGPFQTPSDAIDALVAEVGFFPGTNGFEYTFAMGAYKSDGYWSAQTARSCAQLESVYGTGDSDFSVFVYHYLDGSCPAGMSIYPGSGSVCVCDIGIYNFNSQSCVVDDGQPDDSPEQDDSDNTGEGSDGNDHGGEPGDTDGDGQSDDGSECNFAPEGCLPGDTSPDPPDLTDIDPPEPDEPIPPTATRTKEETTDNTDGSTTGKTTDSWTEGDGCKVTQTTSTTNNPDGSGNKNTTTTRRCPDGTTTSTTGKWEIDDQGNSTLSGSSSSKEIEGGDESKRSSSGGGDCTAAPKCSGDAIDCATQLQVWLLRCDKNTEYADSPCTAQPKCDGDVLLCAGLINTWQDRCAMERAAFDTQKEFTDRGFQTAEQTAQSGGVFGAGQVEDISTMADGVFSARSSISGSCPSSINLNLPLIGSLDFSLQPLCDAASAIYWLVLLSAYVVAAFIIFRSVTEPV